MSKQTIAAPQPKPEQRARQRNNAFDYVRVVAFCGVVALHAVTPDGPLSTGMNVLARFSVPFFFSLAGFFSLGASEKKLIGRIASTGKLCTIAVALYAVTSLLSITPSIGEFIEMDGLGSTVRNFVLWNAYPSAYPLWFLFALLYVYCFAYISVKVKAKPRDMICLGMGLIAARFTLTEFSKSIDPLGCEMRSWLFFGIPFYCIGLFLRSRVSLLRSKRLSDGFIIALAGMVLSFLECYVFGLQEVYLGTIALVVGCYIVCIKHPMTSFSSSRWTRMLNGGEACLVAYLVHYALICSFTGLLVNLGLTTEGFVFELGLMCTVALLSLAIGVVVTGRLADQRTTAAMRGMRR